MSTHAIAKTNPMLPHSCNSIPSPLKSFMNRYLMFKFAFSLLLLLSSQLALALSYTIEITEQEIQKRVTAMKPIQYTKPPVTIEIQDPEPRLLKDTNEIAVSSPLELAVGGLLKVYGYVNAKGTLRYEPTAGEFFLDQPMITEMEIKKLPEKYQPMAREAAQLAIEKTLAMRPIYKLKDNDLKQKLMKAVLQSVVVKNDRMVVTLSVF